MVYRVSRALRTRPLRSRSVVARRSLRVARKASATAGKLIAPDASLLAAGAVVSLWASARARLRSSISCRRRATAALILVVLLAVQGS